VGSARLNLTSNEDPRGTEVARCDHGYSSILAAGNLVKLGFHWAGDVIGGFEAWKCEGLPVGVCPRQPVADGVLPGTGPPG
jgi:rhodanese-related sulfurtransferase